MSINPLSKFLSTSHTCIYFDISSDFLNEYKKNGIYKNGIHYAQPVRKMLRWNIQELEKWFGFTAQTTNIVDNTASDTKVNIDNFLK